MLPGRIPASRPKAGIHHVIRQFVKTKRAIKRYSDEDMLAYKEREDREIEGCMKLLSRTSTIAWMADETNGVAFIAWLFDQRLHTIQRQLFWRPYPPRGLPMSVMVNHAREFIEEIKQYTRSAALTHSRLYRQLALNLVHRTADPF
jgi:hypothetical protein